MGADGLTIGAVARSLLHTYMDGLMTLQHEHSQWGSKAGVTSASSSKYITLDTCWEMQHMHAVISFATSSPIDTQHSVPASWQSVPAMADLLPGQDITLRWAEKLGQVPGDFYWCDDNLYRSRPDNVSKSRPHEVNFSHAVNVVQRYALQ